MSLDLSQIPAVDNFREDSPDSDSILALPTEEGKHSKKGNDKQMELGQLCVKVEDLILRVTKLEQNFNKRSSGFLKAKPVELGKISENESVILVSGRKALGVVNHNLITSKPRNASICQDLRHGIVVLRRYNFALIQCFLLFVTLGVLTIFGALKFCEAYQSVNDPYKPYKVDGRDEYYRNEDLKYELPLHYFWFEFAVSEDNFYGFYNQTFGEKCDSMLKDCLQRYIEDLTSPSYELSPSAPAPPPAAPQGPCTPSPAPQPLDPWMTAYEYAKNDAPVSAQCLMTTSSNNKVMTETIGLRNLTLHLDEIGVNLQNDSGVTNIFGMIIRLEFDDLSEHMSGNIMCDLYLDMDHLKNGLSGFAFYDIWFMVSREEFSSWTTGTGITEYIDSMKKVWRRQSERIDLKYSYVFEENTYDRISDFTAEVYLVDEDPDEDRAMLNIEVYPYPTVWHYIKFARYSYLDWVADIGGLFTFALFLFFLLTNQITKLANRRDLFRKKLGILPAFSLRHRNAEEIAGLRSLVMAGLGITEEEYFK